jgi:myo-inositol-1(or 4)-monophosphatase
MTDYAEFLPVATEAIDQGAKLIRNGNPGAHTAKGDRDYATELDFSVERQVRQFLADATPDIGFLGEEDGGTDGDGLWRTLDPIDGTVNFAHHMPLCAISLALMSSDQPVLGVIDLPFLGDRYTAVQGRGARKNNEPIHVSNCERLADAVVAIGDYAVGEGSTEKNRQRLALTEALAGSVLRVRMLGSAAIDLAWVAEGKLDASITLSNQPWDMAAGVVLTREAGAEVRGGDGTAYALRASAVIASPPPLWPDLKNIVSPHGGPIVIPKPRSS